MIRRAVPPYVERARLLPWHVEIETPATGLGHALNLLLEHCRRTYAADAWHWPGPGAVWCFADRQAAESFANHAGELTGRSAAVRDSRATKAPPWEGKQR